MKALAPLELIAAHDWQRATITTYAFSAAFAEAVLVEALMRQGVSEIVVLVDPLGYRMALRERGAVRIGREYIVHPIAVTNGCFHPKILVLEAEDVTHALVGSNNLTFGGWSNNLECIDHLHTNGMAEAIADLGTFFAQLASAKECQHEAKTHCLGLASRLTAAAAAGKDNGNVRLVHSLDAPIAGRIAGAAVALGGAERLAIASPYWDRRAVETLVKDLSLMQCSAHVPRKSVPAPPGMDWPRGSKCIVPVEIAGLIGDDQDGQGLHAKLIEVVCANGRLVIAGSANATGAGLLHGGASMQNVEVCTLRTDRGVGGQWKLAAAKAPPKPSEGLEDDDDDEERAGILVASHAERGIEGRILTPWQASSADVMLEVTGRPVALGRIPITGDRRFIIPLDILSDELSLEGRLQLRLEHDDAAAEGFVTAPDFGQVRRRAGSSLGSMLAALKNMHTPEDVAAVMEFFHLNPDALKTRVTFTRRSTGENADATEALIDAELVGQGGTTRQEAEAGREVAQSELAWQHFVARLLRALSRAKPVTEDEEDETDRAEVKRRRRAAAAIDKLGMRFPQIFQKLTERIESDGELVNLLRLAQFVCVTTTHPLTTVFVQRLLTLAEKIPLGASARHTLAWCLAYLAADGSTFSAATTRARMLKLGINPDHPPDPQYALIGLGELLSGPDADLGAVFAAVSAVRTIHDDVRALEAGLAQGGVPEGLASLQAHAGWDRLLVQCRREPGKRRIQFVETAVKACGKCHIALLHHQQSELARYGVCETTCHGFILARYP